MKNDFIFEDDINNFKFGAHGDHFSVADMQSTFIVLFLLLQQIAGQQQCCATRTVGGTGEKVFELFEVFLL